MNCNHTPQSRLLRCIELWMQRNAIGRLRRAGLLSCQFSLFSQVSSDMRSWYRPFGGKDLEL
jgi:hypothetical protein